MVEGSITVALVAFGGAEASTAYAVLLYRVISFWLILADRLAVDRAARPAGAPGALAPPGADERGGGRPGGLRAGGSRRRRWRGPECGDGRMRTRPGRGLARRWGAAVAGLVVAASLLTACSAARTGQGTTDESCYLALPTAAKAVGGHGHLAGVRKFTLSGLHGVAPRLYGRLADDVPKGQDVCVVAYTGHFIGVDGVQAPRPSGRHAGRGRGDDAGQQAAGHAGPDQDPGALPAPLLTAARSRR